MEHAALGFIVGIVNCWNYFVLKEHKNTIGMQLLNPLPAYISGIVRNFGIPLFLIYLFATTKISVVLVALVAIGIGYFLGGVLYRALYSVARMIGVLSIIPTVICMLLMI